MVGHRPPRRPTVDGRRAKDALGDDWQAGCPIMMMAATAAAPLLMTERWPTDINRASFTQSYLREPVSAPIQPPTQMGYVTRKPASGINANL
jgi:hypothetical protein